MHLGLITGWHRPPPTSAPPGPTSAPPVRVTEFAGEVAHFVAEPFVAAAADSMEATCGRRFLPAALSAPDGRMCAFCEELERRRQQA